MPMTSRVTSSGKSKFGTLLFASFVVAAIAAGFVSGRASVEPTPTTFAAKGYAVVKKLSQGDNGSFQLSEAHTDFDIRPQSASKPRDERDRVQLTVMTDTMRIKRTGHGRYYASPYSTGSKAGIDLRCDTHPFVTEKVDSIDFGSGEEDGFGILIDLGSVPIGEEAIVVVKGYFWNGFQRAVGEDAATYTDPDVTGLRQLRLSIQVPDARSIRRFNLIERQFEGDVPVDKSVPSQQAVLTPDGRRLLWTISSPQPERIYRVVFDW